MADVLHRLAKLPFGEKDRRKVAMIATGEGYILRLIIDAHQRHEHLPLHQWLVHQAKRLGLKSATVLQGLEGFGASRAIQNSHLLRAPDKQPVVIEVVDGREQLEAYLQAIDPAVEEGLATLEKIEICFYRALSTNPR
jgi:PII-like signaling protein